MPFNLHPPLTAFPMVFFVTACGLEFLQVFYKREFLPSTVSVLIILGAFFTVAAFASGYHGVQFVEPEKYLVIQGAIEWHQLIGRLCLFLAVATCATRFAARAATHSKQQFHVLYYVCLLVTTAFLVYTCFLGGQLVFTYGAGVG